MGLQLCWTQVLHLNPSIEIKYQFYISVWLIKNFLHYIIELCEWASKSDLTWPKREYPKREKIPPLWPSCDSCLPLKQVCPMDSLDFH